MVTKPMWWELTKTARDGFLIGGGFAVAGLLAFVGILAGAVIVWQLAVVGTFLLAGGIAYLTWAVVLLRRQWSGYRQRPEYRVHDTDDW
jgi:hypothetical protein